MPAPKLIEPAPPFRNTSDWPAPRLYLSVLLPPRPALLAKLTVTLAAVTSKTSDPNVLPVSVAPAVLPSQVNDRGLVGLPPSAGHSRPTWRPRRERLRRPRRNSRMLTSRLPVPKNCCRN